MNEHACDSSVLREAASGSIRPSGAAEGAGGGREGPREALDEAAPGYPPALTPQVPVRMSFPRRPSVAVLAMLFAVVLGVPGVVPNAIATPIVRNPGDPSYVVSLRTGGQGHVWTGTESVSFTNADATPLPTMYLRLWSNGVLRCDGIRRSITVSNIQGGTASEALDCTELKVDLDTPLAPGARTTLTMNLHIEVPPRNDRFGYHAGLALLGTALPTLEVHDDQGWHHDPFIDLGESFYSITGRYRVTFDTPLALDTPTTGIAVARSTPESGRRVTTYAARDVRDFAWAAGRLEHVIGNSGPTRIVASYQPTAMTRSKARAALRVAERAMGSFSRSFGRFPYAQMDLVLAGFATFGGMEYPTIIFTNPDRLTVSHELAHQWWFGIVGNDEFAEPWLDESFATWSQYLPFSPWKRCNRFRFQRADQRISNDMAYWNAHQDLYGTVYGGGGCMLANLASRFGAARFAGVLGRYASRHWLGVSRTAAFQASVEAAAAVQLPGFDADAFWQHWRVG
jgi:hypothetical protein